MRLEEFLPLLNYLISWLKTNTCAVLLYSGHVQILLDANDDPCVIFCYLGKLASSDFPVAMDKHNCDMRRRYETRAISSIQVKIYRFAKKKAPIFASQIVVFSLKYWGVRTRMAFKKRFFNESVQLSGLSITWLKCQGGNLIKFQTYLVGIFRETKIFSNLWNFDKGIPSERSIQEIEIEMKWLNLS